jgi:hypothetical protein
MRFCVRPVAWWSSFPVSRCCLVLWLAAIDGGGCTNHFSQGRRIDAVAFMDVYGSARLSFKASVEETMRIVKRCTFEKIDLDMILEGSNGHNISVPRVGGRYCRCQEAEHLLRQMTDRRQPRKWNSGAYLGNPLASFTCGLNMWLVWCLVVLVGLCLLLSIVETPFSSR